MPEPTQGVSSEAVGQLITVTRKPSVRAYVAIF